MKTRNSEEPSDPDACWAAVLARDPAADGRFYYSVNTTGIYCRPSCPSRRPKRSNVRFHGSRGEAERAGFRPCRRCRPDEPTSAERQTAAVAAICRHIETADEIPALAELAARAGMSPFHVHRIFKSVTGVTPRAYGAAHRAARLRNELERNASVTEAIYAAGYSSSSRFYEESQRLLGMTPSHYRAGGADTEIRFALGVCFLGSILVAMSPRGVCAIALGDDPEALIRDFQDRFPKAQLVGGDQAFERFVAHVVGFVEVPAQGLDLPLDIRGTVFQQRVWQALREIPSGSQVSYSEIARRIGAPKAVRAVAGACAANILAVAIPCHRVVRIDGDLSGYRWGIARKAELLRRESAL
ncbi:MAG: bifunctional DNA-binding transcriptional regulator/O6-methylguanine-DNA methyltransferase Ada [Methylococcaceae bacterium]|nr:bifunctional DNA-binding transcriptional regulator/O6-methylguanine-DNA methyltransferase Ada [Methylococcaceae bacterium]